MKRKLLIFLLVILGIFVCFAGCAQREFEGKRVANEDLYQLNVDWMNGTDTHVLSANAGDRLNIRFSAACGKLYLEIKEPNGTIIYNGNGETMTNFTVNISESGEYSVRVEARNAKGTIDIRVLTQDEISTRG